MARFTPRFLIPILVLSAAAIVAGTLHLRFAEAESAHPNGSPPAAMVDVAAVQALPVRDVREFSGRLEAVDQVAIRPQVSGTIVSVHFADGALVKKGDRLFTIDPRPYQAVVARAKADLAAAEAQVAHTGSEFARAKRLLAQNAIARKDFEERRHAARVAAATLEGAKAALSAAELDLEHTKVIAPVSGRVSRAEITTGNFVAAGEGSSPLTYLVSVDRIYASFDVDEQSFLNFVSPAQVQTAAHVDVAMGLSNEQGFPRSGRLASIDNRLDAASGTIRVRAVFDNHDGALVPGLFARINLSRSGQREAVVVDETAIGTDQEKRYVLVVGEDDRTSYREVKLGAMQDGMRVIEQGLRPGERIVVSGLQRVRPGDPVSPQIVQRPATTEVAGSGAKAETSEQAAQNAS
jgi:RND family efflux transporter, MFP subunit